ncbi:MAG: hypothetical protein JWL93_677 [Hyphomicrobiales bacterium]|nr:hypothetical protein [Hyphomicrobiales bacterium]
MIGLDDLLGIGRDGADISVLQMGLRAVVIYSVTVVIIRLGRKRFRGRATAFDIVLGIMIGSVASRAITGDAPMVPAMFATGVLVGLHYLLSVLTIRWEALGAALKGQPVPLVRDGVMDVENLRKTHISEDDLREELRCKGIRDLREVGLASLEGSGSISVLRKSNKTKVVEIPITEGIQVVRVEIAQ